ncbi:MAG: hypothetical protein KKG60_01480 [Nanoarchaeota archaeon]|nr:hypothetical protein [Nanoarchaeota archaeon]
MNTKILENIGLTRNQAEIYLALLKLGSATAQQIIKESGMHRSPVYDNLEKLQEHGLVSYVVKDFKKYFQAVPPKKLYSYLEEKKQELAEAMPELEKLEGMKKEEINASIFKGKEGLKTIHLDMLKEGKDIYVLGGKGLIFSELEYFIPHFEKERIKKGLKWKILWDKEKTKKEVSKKPLVEGKVLPKGFDSNCVVNVFGNKVAIFLWKETYPSAFVIDNKDVSDSFRKWFNLIYNKV